MIQVILGSKGTGKTKLLLDMTNNALKAEHGKGNIIFIDDDTPHAVVDGQDYWFCCPGCLKKFTKA